MTSTPPPIMPATIPPELDRWNWGAFLLNWIWGVGNNTFIALLTLIPGVGIIMIFVLGAKGSRWAWRNGRWDSIEHFKRTQRLWAIWGVVIWLGSIVLFGGIFGGTFYLLQHSGAYELGVSRLQASAEAAAVLGTPITAGTPLGSVSSSGSSGRAFLNFSATGPKASGRIFLEAIRQDGVWSLKQLRLKVDGRNDAIDLLQQSRAELEGFTVVPGRCVASNPESRDSGSGANAPSRNDEGVDCVASRNDG
ncbi:hypothetical protein FFI89_001895 [Bradyrhizobium sp. KBS0727]|uniref:cytochrome c oxidase assembly factor Coa1 family protein n=1 Tax=unclassified Bradyrhizobium TaxID=2631580 RepID=UPI00110D7DC4|nr:MULTISPECIES: cytochrome c oxidase assembly factor Coa1 family protein [unclassified Bradyrhizobium]QDW35998.1 hypothetical protein FFI71_001895 [Bradyrhizobium sp. KBS0725]QDW42598.1 hypothetical protein FFI89_001895 [Bradyrhizobium sp. KBS0727]